MWFSSYRSFDLYVLEMQELSRLQHTHGNRAQHCVEIGAWFNLFNYVILQTCNYTWKLCKQTLQIDVNVIYGNVYKKKKPCVSDKSVTSDCLVYCLQKIVYSLYQCTKCCIILWCEIAFVADIHFPNDTHRIMLQHVHRYSNLYHACKHVCFALCMCNNIFKSNKTQWKQTSLTE